MRGLEFTASCLQCGGPLVYCNGTVHNGTESVAAVSCSACRREFYITVCIRAFPRYKTDLDYKHERRLKVSA